MDTEKLIEKYNNISNFFSLKERGELTDKQCRALFINEFSPSEEQNLIKNKNSQSDKVSLIRPEEATETEIYILFAEYGTLSSGMLKGKLRKPFANNLQKLINSNKIRKIGIGTGLATQYTRI